MKEELTAKLIVAVGILWIIGFTFWLLLSKEGRKMESIDIFLWYTGGTIFVSTFGLVFASIALIIYIPVKLLDAARGRSKITELSTDTQ